MACGTALAIEPWLNEPEQPPFAVHGQIPRRPDRRRPNVAGEYGVLGGQLVEHSGHILRMDRFPTRFTRRQLIQALACLLIMFERGLEMRLVDVLL